MLAGHPHPIDNLSLRGVTKGYDVAIPLSADTVLEDMSFSSLWDSHGAKAPRNDK